MLADLADGDYVAAVLETYKRVIDVYGPTQQDAPPLVGQDISVNGLSTTTNFYLR